jgi:hypothetical protein
MELIKTLLRNNWGKWKDISVAESLGYYILIQCRVNNKTGKKQLRKSKIYINDTTEIKRIKEAILNCN